VKAHGRISRSLPYFSYKLLGKKLSPIYPLFNKLKLDLARADMKVSFKAYLCQIFFLTFLSVVGSFGVFFTLNLLAPSLLQVLLPFQGASFAVVFLGPFVIGVCVFLLLYELPSLNANARKRRVEQFLPITASYMSVLSCAGVPPEKIIRSAANADPDILLSEEMRSIIGKMDLLGYNILSALEHEAERAPSPLYMNLLKGLASTIRTGGDVKKFFLTVTKQLLAWRNMGIQQFLNVLGMLAETYVLLFTAFPLLAIIMLSIMASIGGSLAGFDLVQLMYLLTFLIIPVLAAFYILLIDIIQPKG